MIWNRPARNHSHRHRFLSQPLNRHPVPRADFSAACAADSPPLVMSFNKVLVAVVALLVIAAVIYETKKSREIQASLTALNVERDSLNKRVRNLTQLVAEAREREAAAPVTAAVAVVAPPTSKRKEIGEKPGVTTKAPKGWWANGSKTEDFVVGVDQTQTFGGMPSAYVEALDPDTKGFGGMMQSISAEDFSGKRVRLTGWVKTDEANDGGGHLWLRVDGKQSEANPQFDNMGNRPIKGTTDWQQYSVVVDVPTEASGLAYGFFVQGAGKMWVSGTTIEPVGTEVPSTNMMKPKNKTLPKAPVNLGFN